MATATRACRARSWRSGTRPDRPGLVILLGLVPNPLIIPVGFVIGVLIALPIGPINFLALQRAAERGFFGGLAAGIGITLGDALIAFVATFGVKALTGAVSHYRSPIQIVGGLALMASGAKLFLSRNLFMGVQESAAASLVDYVWDIPKHFALTITNPGAVLFLLATFAGASSFVEIVSRVDAFAMTFAIMAGSFVYWLVVSHLISRVRHRLNTRTMHRINQVLGSILAITGGVLVGEMIWKVF